MLTEEEEELQGNFGSILLMNPSKQSKQESRNPPPPKKLPPGYYRPAYNFTVPESSPTFVTGCNAAIREILRCCVCKKFPSEKIHECESEGHIVCNLCFQLLNPTPSLFCCPFKDYKTGAECESPMRDKESMALSQYVQGLKFRCIYPTCSKLIDGKSWKNHLKKCSKRKLTKCHDDRCRNLDYGFSIKKFLNHCHSIHEISTKMPEDDGSFEFKFKDQTHLTRERTWIVAIVQTRNGTFYFVGQRESPTSLYLSCFMLGGNTELAGKFQVQVVMSPEIFNKQEKGTVLLTVMPVNSHYQDLEDAKMFGRSAHFAYQKIEKLLRSAGRKFDASNFLVKCTFMVKPYVDQSLYSPSWKPIPNWTWTTKWKSSPAEKVEPAEKSNSYFTKRNSAKSNRNRETRIVRNSKMRYNSSSDLSQWYPAGVDNNRNRKWNMKV